MSELKSATGDPVSAVHAVVERLEAHIVDEAEPGEMLPSEGDLAAQLGVSRLTVREALKLVSGRGLVELSKGRRPIVLEQDSSVLRRYFAVAVRRDPRGALELNEIRRSLEVMSAASAARRAGRVSRDAIDRAFQRMVEAAAAAGGEPFDTDSLEAYHQADLDFHAALAMASGNRLLALLLEGLTDCLHESFRLSAAGHFARGGSFREVLQAHEDIAAAVDARDSAKASRAMRTHLDSAARDLRAAMRLEEQQPATRRGPR